MKILAIETSCDETAISVLECEGDQKNATFKILGNVLLSQIDIHREFGGVFPAVAKREHAKNLVPVLAASLEEAELLHEDRQVLPDTVRTEIGTLLTREPELAEALFAFLDETETPDIDAIAVTHGPGLEPALWVGVNLARALSMVWGKPLIGVNHVEGHIVSGIAVQDGNSFHITQPALPLLSLGIAGGHTDLVLMHEWLVYTIIGGTLDDSVGEAFDKVARMLGLPYPGGPEVSRLAEAARVEGRSNPFTLPRPMLRSGTHDFSFSGLKTAVLYLLKNNSDMDENMKKYVALEFEDAVADVLWAKTAAVLEETETKTLVVSGGVSANAHVRRVFKERLEKDYSHVSLHIPINSLATDNAIMIAMAGYYRALNKEFIEPSEMKANGNLSLA
ncbi:MAG: tRNA (adenosine(37)-N6)-threonylcarbamoyltransferase complex transferase subunit TsaD [Patescibacteria group bacterium]